MIFTVIQRGFLLRRRGVRPAMLGPTFELQGHRGARGLRPENTLPSFEAALDVGVTAVETDVHLTADGVPVLFHDARVTARLCRPAGGARAPSGEPPVSTLTLAELRACRADRNPAPERFPDQNASATPLAAWFAAGHGTDPYTPPTLAELFAFCAAYAGPAGRQTGKGDAQRRAAGRLRFDLELKRVPFRPEVIGDDLTPGRPGRLERAVVEAVRAAGVAGRTTVRSFDHRAAAAVRHLEPRVRVAVLVAGTAPVEPAALARQAGAEVYCPDVEFLDEAQVRQLHADGVRVLPWTVNDAGDAERLLAWGVDGITTDYPDRLADLLRRHGIPF
jgi:glycerophosphoryl diester phosphodiesterase